jgi:calcineurin-like phosphoesterase family protein
MSNLFFIADLHLGHLGLLSERMGRLRPYKTLEAMHTDMVERWNKTVTDQDTVYVVGDVSFKKSALALLNDMNGKKVLIRGNHDTYTLNEYAKYFYDIKGSYELRSVTFPSNKNIILTHIPVHPSCVDRYELNVHGHLHTHVIRVPVKGSHASITDPRYLCVSVEQKHINYTPIELSKLIEQFEQNQRLYQLISQPSVF